MVPVKQYGEEPQLLVNNPCSYSSRSKPIHIYPHSVSVPKTFQNILNCREKTHKIDCQLIFCQDYLIAKSDKIESSSQQTLGLSWKKLEPYIEEVLQHWLEAFFSVTFHGLFFLFWSECRSSSWHGRSTVAGEQVKMQKTGVPHQNNSPTLSLKTLIEECQIQVLGHLRVRACMCHLVTWMPGYFRVSFFVFLWDWVVGEL